ncbi:hypothetical protein ERO13_D08G082500v2 [Gossypium hirsutum]|uniref:MLO-like protein 9 isoform X1 n=1 Tax=Gossypium hirsutum TaxID=3635 RepID=A0ABM3ALR2_GOSHI|nr:MLO-like protein 9 isoform X1 [Gossypium hirsutum]XP_040955791.1 MLO-like protein 9 isoform X1 [Gossypium hirsutum]KAG4133207.1 hypothetical protein ERO13_D08G082500v2 [Gossypium hirsutum]KAG4133208.1 hypothetical protein ERO13_D08G082500v2 [Gossypium hirsutum]
MKYIKRSLEDDFKVVVGISPIIWFIAVLFLLAYTHGWYSYLWLPFIPLIYEFTIRSCYHEHIEDVIIRVSMGVIIQFLFSYVTLPLYALVTQFNGLDVLGDGNAAVIKYLDEKLSIIMEESYEHKYLHDWRTKKPTIFRATEQWFASVEGFHQAAMDAIGHVKWIPAQLYSLCEKTIVSISAGKYWAATATAIGDVYMWDGKKSMDKPPVATRLHRVKGKKIP